MSDFDGSEGKYTICFNHFTNHKRSHNTIWEYRNEEGQAVHGFKDLIEYGVHHFSNIYKELDATNITEIVKFFSYFPILVSPKENDKMF